ncbi:MAG: hypothetical protein GX933_05200 [Chloroflexi bacterium]|nr:hypothetical protein [Chloroflexota bacterium]
MERTYLLDVEKFIGEILKERQERLKKLEESVPCLKYSAKKYVLLKELGIADSAEEAALDRFIDEIANAELDQKRLKEEIERIRILYKDENAVRLDNQISDELDRLIAEKKYS